MWLFSGWNPGYVISLLLWECFIRFTFWQLRWQEGSVTGVAFYNLVLFLIYAVEIIIGNVLLPMVRVYMIIRVLNFLGPEDMLGKLSEFLELIIRWTLKTALACVIGANLIQGMISPRSIR